VSRSYTLTAINLKATPLGEADRLLTVLSPEQGVLRLVAPGARKPKSKLGGRMSLFVINQLQIQPGRSLDRILQAETQSSYPRLATQLGKLTVAHYLAELSLGLGLSQHPQADLYYLLCEHLSRLEQAAEAETLPHLVQASFHLLAQAGLAPQVQTCCLTQQPLQPKWEDDRWRVSFNAAVGGLFQSAPAVACPKAMLRLTALELHLLQQLAAPDLPRSAVADGAIAWSTLEQVLRQTAQHQLNRPLKSARLVETHLAAVSASPHAASA
jgi:DNA repair protein RecO (recombination protein O)